MATQNNFKVKTGIEMPSLDTFVATDQTQIPSVQPSLNLDFTTKQLDPRITFARADSTACATYTDALGLIKTAPANVPRFDHDPISGKCLGLLIEESRTNLLLSSSAITSSPWVKASNYWWDSNVHISPDGTLNADSYGPISGQVSFVSGVPTQTISLNAGTYTVSTYVKLIGSATTARFLPYLSNSNTTIGGLAYLTGNGSFTAGQNDGNNVLSTSSTATGTIKNVGNGWYRIAITFTLIATATFGFRCFPYVGSTQLTGDGTSGLALWGTQLEVGAFPTSYIDVPSTTAVTRATDYASMTGTNFSSWYNQEQGSIQMQYRLGTKLASIRVAALTDGIGQNYIEVIGAFGTVPQITSGPYLFGLVNGATVINTSGASKTNVPYNTIKFSGAYKLNDYISYTNDVSVGSADNSAGIPTVDRLYFGNNINASGSMICGHLQKFTYYPKRLSNTELQALSTL